MTKERFKSVSFSYPHSISVVSYITSRPQIQSKLYSLINIFDTYNWVCIFLTFIIMVMFVIVFAHLAGFSKNDLIWMNIQTFFGQSFDLKTQIRKICGTPFRMSWELFYLTWTMYCSTIMIIYGNSIYSQMVLPPTLQTISTIEKLIDENSKGRISIGFFEDTSSYNLIRVTCLK